jgi:fimbrial chaperone protein
MSRSPIDPVSPARCSAARRFFALGCAIAALAAQVVYAATFQVSPVLVDVAAGQSAAVITLTNQSTEQIALQVRTFKWSQIDGAEQLTPTQDVIASPPIVEIPPGAEHIIRLVRLTRTPPIQEEAYRVWIDQLPTGNVSAGDIRLLVRQSIPLFFGATGTRPSALEWRVSNKGGEWQLTARNPGQQRVRLSDMTLADERGRVLSRQQGLAGYVLAGSTKRWPLALATAPDGMLVLSASSPAGPVNVRIDSHQP